MRAVGVHVYGGGFSCGLRSAGFDIVRHLETSGFGRETSQRNLDVEVVSRADEWSLPGDIDVLYANPPCAPWSGAGVRRGRNDPRANDIGLFMDLALAYKPKVFLWESVQGAFKAGYSFVMENAERAVGEGYRVHLMLYDNQHLGVPHKRRRFMFVATRYRMDVRLHNVVEAPTVAEVLDGVPIEESPRAMNWGEEIAWHETEPGGVLWKGFERFAWREYGPPETWPRSERGAVRFRPGFLLRILDPEKHSPAVMGTATLCDWREPRFMGLPEQKALAGYPADWWLPGTDQSYGLLGKAVMPICAEWFGMRIMDAIGNEEPIGRPRATVHDLEKQAKNLLQMELSL